MPEDSLDRAMSLLDDADACHDADPARARDLLHRIDLAALPAAARPRAAFLFNHVLGEKFGDWPRALNGLQDLVASAGADAGLPLRRQACVAATLAGDAILAAQWTSALAAAADAPLAAARAIVDLAAASYLAPAQDAASAGRAALHALHPLTELLRMPTPALDAQLGAVTNNLASHLLERPLPDLQQTDLRAALATLAEHALSFWQRTGQWVQHERAHYLCALAANALGDGARGADAAAAGLALLDRHDVDNDETVDRTFLEQELAQGLRLAGRPEADLAQQRANAGAAAFGDAGLTAWFEGRARRNGELLAFYRA